MSKKKRKKKKGNPMHQGNIMAKRKVHKNEDLKLYDRKRTRKEEREEV